MPETYNIYEAKTHLSALVDRALKGEEVIIAKAGEPQVTLVPVTRTKPKRVPGKLKGKIWVAPGAFSPRANAEIAADFYKDDDFSATTGVLVTKLGKPVQRVELPEATLYPERLPGKGENKGGWVADDFDAPLPSAMLKAFYGSHPPARGGSKRKKRRKQNA